MYTFCVPHNVHVHTRNDCKIASVGAVLLRDRQTTMEETEVFSGAYLVSPCQIFLVTSPRQRGTQGEVGEGEKGHFGVVRLLLMDFCSSVVLATFACKARTLIPCC